jgi:chromosome segregation ATPase
MQDDHKKRMSLAIGAFAVIALAIYQYIAMTNQIKGLENTLQLAQGTITDQTSTIQEHQKTLKDREAEITRKEEQLQEKEQQIKGQENQIQEQRGQLQAKEENLRNQRVEIERQERLTATLRANTETLGICLAGVSLAIAATTPRQKEAAFTAIVTKCEEAGEILETL